MFRDGNPTGEVKLDIAQRIKHALLEAARAGELQVSGGIEPSLEVPPEREYGDYASNVAMALGARLGVSPRAVAETIQKYMELSGHLKSVEVAGPGFLNFRLDPAWLYRLPAFIRDRGPDYGKTDHGRGRKVQVEFVSANPTGPLVVVSARAGAVGDTLANLLKWAGYHVEREYYINDAGRQVELLAESLEARLRELRGEQVDFPEEGYPGEYLVDMARELLESEGAAVLEMKPAERRSWLIRYAVSRIIELDRRELADYGVLYDVWFSEMELHRSGALKSALELLGRKGCTYERDGALWLSTTRFGDDKDRVLVKSDGSHTYFLADIAYHKNKFERGFQKVIDIWGPDHHGYIPRLKAAVQALGYPEDSLEVMIVQLVRLVSGGRPVRMSKRAGAIALMSDLLEEVGKDAARYFFLMRSADSHLDFDLDLAKLQSQENPVYYVQYAHARICSILRQAEAEGVELPPPSEADHSLLNAPAEHELLRKMAGFPEEIIQAAESRQPHFMTRYASELATSFHSFYTQCRVLGEDAALTAARLSLVDSVRIVLRNALGLLGVTPPDRM